MSQTSQRTLLHWQESGDSTGAVLLLVHGFPFSSAMWRPQLEAPPAGWRLIAPDLRGFGETAPAGPDSVTMDSMADDLAALLQHVGASRAVVCGLSMGGYITFAVLRRHPQLVRALVLCDTRPEPDTEEIRRGRAQSAARVTREGTASVVESMLPRVLAQTTLHGRPDVTQEVRSIMETASPAGVVAALRAMASRPDSRPMLRGITVPTQVIVGTDDQITPAGEAQLMARAIPGSRIEVIRDAGHLPNLENAAAFNRSLFEFLGALPD
jgi:pimeloyl-ACP methyl ester carboxylesterase